MLPVTALALLLLCCAASFVTTAAAAATDPAPEQAQHAICYLDLRGRTASNSRGSTFSTPALASANLTCVTADSSAPASVPVSIDTTRLKGGAEILITSGVIELQDDCCKQQAAEFALHPLFFFCGSYSVSFEHPTVDHVWLHSVDNRSADTFASGGVAMLAFGGRVNASLSGASFVSNTAGKIILLQGNASMLVTASNFSSNTISGSCIWAMGSSSLIVQRTALSSNLAYSTELTDGGAALYVADDARVGMTACSMESNAIADTEFGSDTKRSGRWGGAIRTRNAAKLTMHSCLLRNNTAYLGGGLFAGGQTQVRKAGSLSYLKLYCNTHRTCIGLLR
jgi:hypothetical protein